MNRIFAPLQFRTEPVTTSPEVELEGHAFAPGRSVQTSVLRTALAEIGRRAALTDVLLFVYLASVVRQYLWVVERPGLAWALTILLTALACAVHVKCREENAGSTPFQFWLVVALPLLLVYALRAPYPDQDFDVLNYHLVNSARAMNGWPFIAGDFFPTVLQVNPTADIAAGIFRSVLGYRLGTLINYFALIWAALIVERFLRLYVTNTWLRSAGVLFVVSTEYIFSLLNNYRIDLLAVPLLLEATYLALRLGQLKKRDYTLIHIALFLGISAAFKLSNLAFAVPVVLVCAAQVFPERSKFDARYVALACLAFAAPLLPFSLFLYWQTGNPVFPFYNRIFKSPYLPASNVQDPIYGPKTLLEIICWPVWAFFYPERISETSGIGLPYTGRISLGFIISVLCVFYRSVGREVRTLCFLTLAGSVLWSALTGNVRYGLYLEALAGIAILSLFSFIYDSARSAGKHFSRQTVMFVLLFGGLLLTQSVASYRLFFRHSPVLWNRVTQPTFFENPGGYLSEAQNFLRDQTAATYLNPQERELFDRVEVWINSIYTTNGVEVVLKKDIPILSVSDYMTTMDYLSYEVPRVRFAEELARVRGKRMYTLSLEGENLLESSLKFISRAGLTVGEIHLVQVPWHSQHIRRSMLLIEVLPSDQEMHKDEISALVKKFGVSR